MLRQKLFHALLHVEIRLTLSSLDRRGCRNPGSLPEFLMNAELKLHSVLPIETAHPRRKWQLCTHKNEPRRTLSDTYATLQLVAIGDSPTVCKQPVTRS